MTYYSDCGWAPFGWTKTEANVGECNVGTNLQDNKCTIHASTGTVVQNLVNLRDISFTVA